MVSFSTMVNLQRYKSVDLKHAAFQLSTFVVAYITLVGIHLKTGTLFSKRIKTILFFQLIQDKESKQADKATQILSNLTRDLTSCNSVFSQLQDANIGVDMLINILCQEKYNSGGQEMNFLGPVLSNLSQLPKVKNGNIIFGIISNLI